MPNGPWCSPRVTVLVLTHDRTPQHPVVRRDRADRDGPPVLDAERGVHARGLRRPAGDRHRHHLVRAGAVQRAPAAGRRVGQARGVAGGRVPAGVPGHGPWRDAAAAHPRLAGPDRLAMEAEELMRANPLDGVVLLSGCDKTTPGLLMAAASVDLPAVMVTGGPMLNGKYQGTDVGSGTAVWRFEEDLVAGRMTQEECVFAEGCMARSNGHCMTMGTASTMASMAEALGMQLPYSATWPAVDARRYETAQRAGQVIVGLVQQELPPSAIMTRAAFENAIRVNAAIGGSTNAVIHLLAIAGRLGVPLTLDDFDVLARDVPTLVNLQPSGKYLMEDFCYAGGLPAVIRELDDNGLLHSGAMTVTGSGIGANVADAPCWNREVIQTVAEPFQPTGTGTA